MNDVLNTILNAAVRVGAPIVKGVIKDAVGNTIGGLAGNVIDAVSNQLGVPPEQIPLQPEAAVQAAVLKVESVTPELILAFARQQELSNQLQQAEMDKGPLWSWAWRPAWMWFLMVIWGFVFLVIPIINATFKANIPLPDMSTLSALTIAYLGLYMGGNTVKAFAQK